MKCWKVLTLLLCLGVTEPTLIFAQSNGIGLTSLPLNDLSAFRPAADNWRIAGGVVADRNQKEAMKASAGKGVLVNIPSEKKKDNLVTVAEYGDLELELDFMMANGSNSGIYLQGRYEIQLHDSWGVKNPDVQSCGAIYERWDDSKPEGQKGYEGHAPRVNVSRAPGLWQHYRIVFQAPRFNAQGQKIQNAKVLEIILNGVTIQENVEITGPTRGAAFPNEVPVGALLIQGDHGPIAFRNIQYKNYDKAPITLADLKYSYYGKFDRNPDFTKLKATSEGPTSDLTWELSKTTNDFILRFTGKLKIKEPGEYKFSLFCVGEGRLVVANKTLYDFGKGVENGGTITLAAGDQPIEVVYAKIVSWDKPALGLYVEGPGISRHPLHLLSSIPMGNPVDPILLEANGSAPTLLRSFVDYQPNVLGAKGKRLTHAISVGNAAGAHYTMDLENGALIQAWKGSFLNMTPMWHERGDGTSRPMGSVLRFNDAPLWQVLNNPNTAWIDTLSNEAAYRFNGYDIDESGRPIFKYSIYGTAVEDLTTPEENGKILTRTLKVSGANVPNLYVRVVDGTTITLLADGSYVVNDKEYYVKVEAGAAKPVVRTVNNRQELLVPVSGADKGTTLKYSIIW